MKIQGRMFIWLSVFILIMAIVYGVWSKEPAGTTALFLAFGLAVMIGFYLGFTARRVDAGAQDDKEADVADDAGELGFFSPHSWQPLMLGFGGAIAFPQHRGRLVADVLLRPVHPDRSVRLGVRVLPR
ncbi:cytochrome c oxidase subunit 4 [Streptomyces tricolor]|nr:cytochrome c oxidase subunit 4 [Streptomyces tricolor]